MDWHDWAPTDAAIRADFGYPVAADLGAARELAALLRPGAGADGQATPRWRALSAAVRNRRDLVVLGCGPALERVQAAHLAGRTVVACDGATGRLREVGVVPSVFVTDLDGDPDALRWAADAGAIPVVHAHGDNRPQVRAVAPALGPQAVGTHAVAPDPALSPLRSHGGFTDGDRAVLLLEALGARHAALVAFEYDAPPSRHSHRWDPATKPRKLAWARRIIDAAAARGRLGLAQWTPP